MTKYRQLTERYCREIRNIGEQRLNEKHLPFRNKYFKSRSRYKHTKSKVRRNQKVLNTFFVSFVLSLMNCQSCTTLILINIFNKRNTFKTNLMQINNCTIMVSNENLGAKCSVQMVVTMPTCG